MFKLVNRLLGKTVSSAEGVFSLADDVIKIARVTARVSLTETAIEGKTSINLALKESDQTQADIDAFLNTL